MIRPASIEDAEFIARIYNHYILNSHATFEVQAVDAEEIGKRIRDIKSASLPYLVAEMDGKVIGYSYAAQWKKRYAYRFSVECTVYLDHECVSKGLGTQLYQTLLEELKTKGIHVAIGGIALPNPASVALHERLGFKKVAQFNEVGFKFDKWIDVGYWEKHL